MRSAEVAISYKEGSNFRVACSNMLEYAVISFNVFHDVKTEHTCYVVEITDDEKEAVKLVNRLIFETDVGRQASSRRGYDR